MREPFPPLGLVDAQPLETIREASREATRTASLVGEREHPDAARLAIAGRGKDETAALGGAVPHRLNDRPHVGGRAAPQEDERDVEVPRSHEASGGSVRERLALPRDEALDGLFRERKGDEEAKTLIAPHASRWNRANPACSVSERA